MSLEIRRLSDGSALDCGDARLNDFLARYAGQNQFRYQISVTYLAVEAAVIVGYSTISPGVLDEIQREGLPRKMPKYPLPVLRLCRLGVSVAQQGTGVGKKLVRQCLELAVTMTENLGCIGILADAYHTKKAWYEALGFRVLHSVGPTAAIPMFLPIGQVEKAVKAKP